MSHNYSLYGIPAYWTLAMVPHIYSVVLASKNKQKWGKLNPLCQRPVAMLQLIAYNTNSRSDKFSASLKKTLPPDTLARYERARAAHTNMLSENMALFVGAVLAGNMAGLDAGFMNNVTGGYLVSRVAYLACYIYIRKQRYAMLRTIVFNVGCGMLLWVYFKAARAWAAKVEI